MQFVHTVDDYVENIAESQSNATFELGTLNTRPSSAAVHWYRGAFNVESFSSSDVSLATTRCGSHAQLSLLLLVVMS